MRRATASRCCSSSASLAPSGMSGPARSSSASSASSLKLSSQLADCARLPRKRAYLSQTPSTCSFKTRRRQGEKNRAVMVMVMKHGSRSIAGIKAAARISHSTSLATAQAQICRSDIVMCTSTRKMAGSMGSNSPRAIQHHDTGLCGSAYRLTNVSSRNRSRERRRSRINCTETYQHDCAYTISSIHDSVLIQENDSVAVKRAYCDHTVGRRGLRRRKPDYEHTASRMRIVAMAMSPGSHSGTSLSSTRSSSSSASSSSSSSPSVVVVAADLKGKEKSKFVATRLRVFFGILIGYSCYYLTRNSLNFTAPVMVASPELNLDISSIGVITSVFPLFYGCSKFVSGVVGDRLSPRIMLAGGLLMTSVINILFGFSSTLQAFCVLWAMNGILQGFGAPSCAKILTSWFASKERGTYWGMWNIAHNLGGFAAPLVAGTAARNGGWSWGLWAPGLTGVCASSLLLLNIRDSPEKCGFPPAEAPDIDIHEEERVEDQDKEEKPPLLKTLFDNVLSNPRIWALALVYFCVYIVRQGITSWSVFYLINAKGAADAAVAALRVSGLELGGLAGSLLAGKLSDYLIKKAKPGEGLVGKRIRVVSGYLVGIAAMLTCFWAVPSSQPILQWLIVFMIGFFLYGPQMLIGLCGAEIVGRESVGASEGFLGWVAYLGAANAGIPLSLLVKKLGWSYFFITLIIACGAALLLLIPLANAKSFIQREIDTTTTSA